MLTDRLVGLLRDELPAGETIGIALSGGGDSTALFHLCLAAGFRVEAVTVDHRLRPESAGEAAAVGRACADLGVPHAVRVWEHGAVAGNLMDAARRARMALILAWARERGIGHVALGHTQDDQAETFLMGLARQAGLPGLSGMRRRWEEAGVTYHRPLLEAGRAELRDWLRDRGLEWVDDPTNENARYQRVRARAALAALAPLGITAGGLAAVAGNLSQAQAALAVQVRAAAGHLRVEAGALALSSRLWEAPDEVHRQVLVEALRWLTGASYAPRAADLARFLAAVRAGRDATLAGCRFRKGWLLREAHALGGPVRVGLRWDGRWEVLGPAGEVRALGAAGLRQCPDWRETGLPRAVLEVTPGIWDGDRLLAAPVAGWPQGWSARLVASDHLFGLSD
ncbi:MAG: tRNA lysidine(34) synthetase TilS [Tabrizicola sp.]|nr:tRNA lysidine(34) synthetase TilS [Tabrizicola sp.]